MFEKSKLLELLRGFFNIWNILRSILIMICLYWFLRNAIAIVEKYLEYNTIVMVEYKQPNETDLPALTVCAYSFANDDELENENPLDYPLWDNSTTDEKYARRLRLRDKAFNDKKASEIFDLIKFDKVVYSCNFYPTSKSNTSGAIRCVDISEIVESINQGRKCFTIFSQINYTLNNQMKTKLEYEMNPFIEIILTNNTLIKSNDYFFNETSSFTIHSPNIIPTGLDYKYYLVLKEEASVYYDIRFTKQISHLKPPPYKTKCSSYKFENPPGSKSRGDCLNRCISERTFQNNCFNYYSIITKDLIEDRSNARICTQKQSSYKMYASARRFCLNSCQMSCVEEYIEIGYADYYLNSVNSNAIGIRSDSTPYTIVYHEEAMERPELLGNLGGHAHIWLGLSALKLFNFMVHLVNRLKKVFFN